MNRAFRGVFVLTSAAALLAAAPGCSDDSEDAGAGGSGGSGASSNGGSGGGDGGNGGGTFEDTCEAAGIVTTDCTLTISPSADDTDAVQTALIEAAADSIVCLCPGEYSFNNEIQISTPGITLRGMGSSRDEVVLDFAEQMGGDQGVNATGDDFTVENLSLKNAKGDGITATQVENVAFRNLKVFWDAGSSTDNGAYAVYPVGCTNVLVENCEIVGASDAGVYVGQSTNIIVRDNDVHGNVAGIEIENCTDAEVHNNKSYDNSAGILVFTLPNLTKKDGLRANIHDNEVYDNNHENFAEEGTIVAAVPPGIGILLLAADESQFHANDIHDNVTGGIVIVSHATLSLLTQLGNDPDTDGYPETTYIYENTFANNGTAPSEPLDVLPVIPVENVLWDGIEKTVGGGAICLSDTPPTFRNIHGVANLMNEAEQTTDTTDHECEQEPLPPIEL